jgi:alpha-amylase
VELCRLAGLPDLNQTNPFVSNELLNWIANLTSFYGFDGVRIDTVPEVFLSFYSFFLSLFLSFFSSLLFFFYPSPLNHSFKVDPSFWTLFQKAAGVYGVGEVYNGDVNYVASYQGVRLIIIFIIIYN